MGMLCKLGIVLLDGNLSSVGLPLNLWQSSSMLGVGPGVTQCPGGYPPG